jgi:hypothetical protein
MSEFRSMLRFFTMGRLLVHRPGCARTRAHSADYMNLMAQQLDKIVLFSDDPVSVFLMGRRPLVLYPRSLDPVILRE